ncbi:MAG: calcium/sodium antiporter [Candidatus Amulumruptor caecigallinarius]|nr:calcium/sodium antiporter [Candidatus Amulumruptor caecigallinarius]MCM1397087.1 calcium/sodium antiporter [Candidatus Amulumruptor caecigallinarius]MCM1454073.1 calcium/sodium antiporter [bacterium]
MLHDIIFFLLGLALVVAGGNFVTDGASALARRFKVSNMVIGLTVVAFGSSMPDLVVCLTSTLAGKSQLALGDIVGANIFDILLVVGVVAMVRPVNLNGDMLGKDLPMLALASLTLFFCGDDILFDGSKTNIIDRTDGLMLLAFFVIFMIFTLREAHSTQSPLRPLQEPLKTQPVGGMTAAAAATPVKNMSMWMSALYIAAGLTALIIGGDWLVDGASGIALKGGLSEAMVGLTIVAIGSAVPDLATSVIAALKNQPGIALGNVVGACIFNVFFILGACATVRPLNAGTISVVDFSTLAGASLLLWAFGGIFGYGRISRAEGAILALCYCAYMTYVIITGVH